MQSLWSLVHAISLLSSQHTVVELEKTTNMKFSLERENEYVYFYGSTHPLLLKDGVIVGKIDVRQSKNKSRRPFAIIRNLSGTCISIDHISENVSDLSHPTPPAHPYPDAEITRSAYLEGKRYLLGFKWSNPDCLYALSQQDAE